VIIFRSSRGERRGEAASRLCRIRQSDAGVVVRYDHPHATTHGRQARWSAPPLAPLVQVVVLGIPRPLLSATFQAVYSDRSRASPYSHHGVERETRLELATLTLARYRSNSVFGKGRNRPLNDYLPPTSTGIHADHTGSHEDPTAVHADHKTRQSPEPAVLAAPSAVQGPSSKPTPTTSWLCFWRPQR
jgi:hypothetical protein